MKWTTGRARWILVAPLAACFDPSYPDHLTCADTKPVCPPGQSCNAANECVETAGNLADASPQGDACPPGDRDEDGIEDCVDECPDDMGEKSPCGHCGPDPLCGIETGFKRLVFEHSNLCLAIEGEAAAIQDGARAEQDGCVTPSAEYQSFALTDRGASRYSIEARHSGKALAAVEAGEDYYIEQSSYSEVPEELWTLTNHGGPVSIESVAIETDSGTPYCLDIPLGGTSEGTDAFLWPCYYGDSQLFRVENVE